ncbi:uncharacterized protein LOC106086941 [Stomoxys calcitrans]|uniref:uncharacterized protein LOC106086941 n=1 Tax=Stomoxys calcitrans TaxID=35570 RepID=UPI0027E2C728|nr:uncharacterized protein LOC106086941 [Stomoxys calcitrans]
MSGFQNGFNDFPDLDGNGAATIISSSRSTPGRSIPYIGRYRNSLLGNISHRPLEGYNGHYEGDTSMLGKKSFLYTSNMGDSDNSIDDDTKIDDHNANINANESPRLEDKSAATLLQESQFWNLMAAYLLRFLPPQMMENFTKFIIFFYESARKGFLYKIWNLIRFIVVCTFRLLSIIGAKMQNGVSLWIFRIHNACRRLLWLMTLAKYGDLLLFLLILLCSPLVFLMAAVGFTLSLYALLKELLHAATAGLRSAI